MPAHVVSFKCVVKSLTGHLISASVNRDVLTTSDGIEAPLQALSEALHHLKKGQRRTIILKAQEAYGFYDPQKVILVPLRKIPNYQYVRQGQTVTLNSKTNVSRTYRVTQIHGDMALLDQNHPLAGQDLVFEIEALDVREATAQELEDSKSAHHTQWAH